MMKSKGGLTTHSTGAEIAGLSSDNLNAGFVVSRPVNSSVMSPLRVKSKLIPAAPQLNDNRIAWIMRDVG
jgi:hypothetical protein